MSKLFVFVEDVLNGGWLHQAASDNELEPDHGFVEFLQYDGKFMNKVGGAFRRSGFPVIGRWRGSRPQNLTREMFPGRTVWKVTSQFDNLTAKAISLDSSSFAFC